LAVPGIDSPADLQPAAPAKKNPWVQGFLVVVLLYLFLFGLKLMGGSFKLLGKDFSKMLFDLTDDPFSGLFVGVLVTAIVQSSSLTTSITVACVAAGEISLVGAIPIIMGANIGTSITNTLVSLVHIRRRDEFRRAFAGAIVHDLFNWCTVLVFFPVELLTRHYTGRGYLERTATWLQDYFIGMQPVKTMKPLDVLIKPLVKTVQHFFCDTLNLCDGAAATVLALLSLALLFFVLTGMTKILKGFVVGRLERIIDHYLFRYAILSYLLGMIATAVVQSSSVTTSLVVPLLGAGLLTLEQVYPYTLGANVGTTVTALIASLAFVAESPPALTCALVHLLFNLHGAALFYPLRVVPISAARWYARLAAERTRYALLFVLGVFIILPLAVIGLSWVLR